MGKEIAKLKGVNLVKAICNVCGKIFLQICENGICRILAEDSEEVCDHPHNVWNLQVVGQK